MRGRLFITISDTNEVRQYAVRPAVAKLVIFLLSGHTLLFVVGLAALAWLASEIDALRFAKQMVYREYRLEADAKSRFHDDAKSEMEHIEETLRKKREELGIINEVTKPAPDKPVGGKGAAFHDSALFRQFLPVGSPTPGITITSAFGLRRHPILNQMLPHNGVDFNVPERTPVQVTADGVVERAKEEGDGYGLAVVIRHPYNFFTLYGHLSSVNVKPGQIVRKGELIAHSGNTGLSSGPHVHYEVLYDRAPIDPAPFVQSVADPSRLFHRSRRVPWASLVAYRQQ